MKPRAADLAAQLVAVNAQLEHALSAQVRRLEQSRAQPWGISADTDVWMAVDPNGRPILLDALAARGQVLAALAQLQVHG